MNDSLLRLTAIRKRCKGLEFICERMGEIESGNKRIAKNTLLLYGRMLITVLVGLYTSRAILNILGVSDYGIYNVVGGVVAMLGFLTASLGGATSRYITFYLGRGDVQSLERVFGNLYSAHILLSVIILVLGETVGLWFMTTQLNIPLERRDAAFWVYQCSLAASVMGILAVPYNCVIIAHEHMSIFALFSIIEAFFKLLIVFCLKILPWDSLVCYAVLFLSVISVSRIANQWYARHNFEEAKARLCLDNAFFKEILMYVTWTITGRLAMLGSTQGINILLNIFYGTVVNAARGVAVQLQSVIMQFCNNFQTALNPQLTKSYASGNISRMHYLLCVSSKFSFCLLFLFVLPIVFEADKVLWIWLGTVPNHTVWFVRLILVQSLFFALANPLSVSLNATGDIKKMQLVEGFLMLSSLPIAYVVLKYFQVPPEAAFVVCIVVEFVTLFFRVYIILPKIEMNYFDYVTRVIAPVVKVLVIAPIVPLCLFLYMDKSWFSFFIVCIVSIVSVALVTYCFACSAGEKKWFWSEMLKIIKKRA